MSTEGRIITSDSIRDMKSTRKGIVRWLCISGFVIHILFLGLLRPIAGASANYVHNRMWSDVEYVPVYETWEVDGNLAQLVFGTAVCIYLPVVLSGITILLFSRNRFSFSFR